MTADNWQDRYNTKVTTAKAAVRNVRPGYRVFIGTGCGEPQSLVRALTEIAGHIPDTEIIHTLTLGVAPHTETQFSDIFRHNAFFVGPNTRQAVAEGRADYTPIFLSELPALFRKGIMPIDVALIQVTPPDEHGYCSLGVSVDIVKAAAETARLVVAEVNSHTPRTLGDSFLHVDDIDFLVPHDEPLLEYKTGEPDEIAMRIGGHIADLVEDGSTIQVGIGAIPNAVMRALKNKKELGIHTEMFSDGVLELFESGAITNRLKALHRGKIIASFCMGTKRLYDFIDNNPLIELHPSEYTNDPYIISQQEKMVAINGALEVDLTGQVCADSLGYLFYSGLGGQIDFMRGAARSEGGKPIIALPSTTEDGKKSRIVPHMSEGAGVVTTRGDVHYVVTEYGSAQLHGKTIRERCVALISIAHPKFREELLEHAKAHNYIYKDQMSLNLAARYPKELETLYTFDDTKVTFRPARPTDEDMMRELFYNASKKTTYYRFHGQLQTMRHRDAQYYSNIDYDQTMVLIGVIHEEGHEHVIAVGQYNVDPATRMAECAFLVLDNYQNKGLGTYLLTRLIEIARQKGIKGFNAEVLFGNQAMLHVFHKSGHIIKSVVEEGVYHISFTFAPEKHSTGSIPKTPT